MAPPIVYRAVESALNTLNNCAPNQDQAVLNLLKVYSETLKNYEQIREEGGHKHPFIVFEGLDGSGKSSMTSRVARKLKGEKYNSPPPSIKDIRPSFDTHPSLRSAYYCLGNYIATMEVAALLRKCPVVMDRYWHSTSAYAIAQAVHDFPDKVEMPPEGDEFYRWPADLLKPDKVIFLDVNEAERLRRLKNRTTFTDQERLLQSSAKFRNNVLLAYRNMVDPAVVFIDANGTPNATIAQILGKIGHLFVTS